MTETLASQLSDHLQHEDQRTLPERLRDYTVLVHDIDEGESLRFHPPVCDEAADALDAKSALLAEAETAMEEATAEAIEYRKNIIELHSGGFEPVPDPKYQIELQKEIARFDALIGRANAVLAKLKAANAKPAPQPEGPTCGSA